MPIWLRKFTISQIIDWKEKEKEAYEKASKGDNSQSTKMGDSVPPHIKQAFKKAGRKPSYSTQKAKK
jgi:hypothetical protein